MSDGAFRPAAAPVPAFPAALPPPCPPPGSPAAPGSHGRRGPAPAHPPPGHRLRHGRSAGCGGRSSPRGPGRSRGRARRHVPLPADDPRRARGCGRAAPGRSASPGCRPTSLGGTAPPPPVMPPPLKVPRHLPPARGGEHDRPAVRCRGAAGAVTVCQSGGLPPEGGVTVASPTSTRSMAAARCICGIMAQEIRAMPKSDADRSVPAGRPELRGCAAPPLRHDRPDEDVPLRPDSAHAGCPSTNTRVRIRKARQPPSRPAASRRNSKETAGEFAKADPYRSDVEERGRSGPERVGGPGNNRSNTRKGALARRPFCYPDPLRGKFPAG